ncbi:MAG TPA: CocE/NonD family hydrolase [Aggregatilineales bacterium]|nr:CocE/NonD family hydrolase [Anaerolineales bacterium]HRE48685.1 CocE/NonD family hydrolase [Aggregatilineales bacterium]
MTTRFRLLILLIVSALLMGITTSFIRAQDDPTKISRLGEYRGYGESIYDSWVRTSQYVPVRDGTRLAVDIVYPAEGGKIAQGQFPILFVHERYGRADIVNGQAVTLANYLPFWAVWVRHGYVLVVADVRGGGASFGYRTGEHTDTDSQDAYDLIDWLVGQSWSSGKVGMMGVSANGISQWLAAGSGHPALKAIVPQMTIFDLYDFVYPGGIYRYEFLQAWARNVHRLDIEEMPVPVDESEAYVAAQEEHSKNLNVYESSKGQPYRDSQWGEPPHPAYADWSAHRMAARINAANTVAVYQIAGWYDMWAGAQAFWYNNLTVPQRIVFTPYSHGAGFVKGWQAFIKPLVNDTFDDLFALNFQLNEHLRFFDYHLKGIDNGIMDEPPVWYYTMGAPAGEGWRSAEAFPLPNEVRTPFYLGLGGSLTEQVGEPFGASYRVDYSTTMGTTTRWHNGHGGAFGYPDMSAQAEKSLTFTTDPLSEAMEITGFPVAHLWVSSSTDDVDVFVYLEEVDENGHAYPLVEGMLRASHRKMSDAPYTMMGLPYQRSFAEDIQPLVAGGDPVELVIGLLPTSNIIDAGHRIRLRITGADKDNHLTPEVSPPPLLSLVFDGGAHPSRIVLPVIPAGK